MRMCRVYLHQAIMGKSNQTIEKTQNYPSVPKSYSTSGNGIGGRKKKKIVKVKPQHWRILIVWKKSNKTMVVKTGVALKIVCHWQTQISELLCSVLKRNFE